MKENYEIKLSVSREHREENDNIIACFENIEISKIDYGLCRLSAGDLPLDITIYIANIIVGGIVWDSLKYGIKNLFKKYDNARVTVKYKNNEYHVITEGKITYHSITEKGIEKITFNNFLDFEKFLKLNNIKNKELD